MGGEKMKKITGSSKKKKSCCNDFKTAQCCSKATKVVAGCHD
jgi:hypothetical protein